jgi:hypothetical protein
MGSIVFSTATTWRCLSSLRPDTNQAPSSEGGRRLHHLPPPAGVDRLIQRALLGRAAAPNLARPVFIMM